MGIKAKKVIILQKITDLSKEELFRTLSEACTEKGWNYKYVQQKEFPFTFKGYLVKRLKFKS